MDRRLFIVTVAVLLPGCAFLGRTFGKDARPLSYVGEITFGAPRAEADRIVIPMTYSGGRWSENSGIVAHSVEVSVGDAMIDMTVITALAKLKPPEGDGHRLVLPPGTKGSYTVYYRDPDGTRHEIGTVVIGN